MKPCCRFESDRSKLPVFEATPLPIAYNSALYRDVRKSLLQDKFPSGCNKCAREEQSQRISRRMSSNQLISSPAIWPETVDVHEIKSLEIFLGNVCNLKCVMCNSTFSTKWYGDTDLLGETVPYGGKPFNVDVDSFTPLLPNLTDLSLGGGEPLLAPLYEKLLKNIEQFARLNELTINLKTNGTIFPDEHTRSVWKKCQLVNVCISVDGLGDTYEFIRYPGKWAALEQNIFRYLDYQETETNIKIYLIFTLSAYNLFALQDVLSWWHGLKSIYREKINYVYINHVANPVFLSVYVLPREKRMQAVESWVDSPYRELKPMPHLILSRDEPGQAQKFLDYTKKIELRRCNNRDYSSIILQWFNGN